MLPTAFIVLDAMPLNPNQKVDRRALPQPTDETLIGDAAITSPTNEWEHHLVTIWQSVLGIQPIGIENNFFDLGGNSLLAVQMLTQVEQELGKKLPITALVSAPTIRSLAQEMSQEQREHNDAAVELVALRSGGTKPPLFCIYGILLYQELVEHLSSDRPVYAIYVQEEVDLLKQGAESEGMAESGGGLTDVPSIATRYLSVIRRLQPHGPYHLAGESFGGVVAFEMAQQLQAVGETVALVALLDSKAPNYMVHLPLWQRLMLHGQFLIQQGPAYLWERLQENLQAVKQKVSATLDVRVAMRAQASQAYFPEPYPGKLVLFRAMERDPFQEESAMNSRDLGWKALAAGGLEIFDIPGDHLGILKAPHVQVLAAQMHACMERAPGSPQTQQTRQGADAANLGKISPDRHGFGDRETIRPPEIAVFWKGFFFETSFGQ